MRESMANKKRVLVIDDDRNTVKYLSVVLGEQGYAVDSARDGAEGLQKVQLTKPDLIVLDVMMPKKSGFVLFKQLKSDDDYKDIPILMVTGVSGILGDLKGSEEDTSERPHDILLAALTKKIREMQEEGLIRPEMFMDKPIDPEAFLAKVQSLIG